MAPMAPPDEQHQIDEQQRGAEPSGESTVIHAAEEPVAGSEARLAAMLEQDASPKDLARELENAEPADAADALESLALGATTEVLDEMDVSAAADALSHMDPRLAASVLADLEIRDAAKLIGKMDPDDAADILQIMPRARLDSIVAALSRKKAAVLSKLLLFDPETAGGIMTTEFLKLRSSSTVAEARAYLQQRRTRLEGSDIYSIYCIDDDGRLEGVLDLRTLLVAEAEQRIGDIMDREVDALRPDLDREEVARAFDRYDFFALPVVDEHRRVLGVVTVDDVIDIIRAEHTEDALKQVGAGRTESVYAPLGKKLRGRAPWLLVNLITSQAAALVVFMFAGVIESLAILAALMGMIANQAGNAGQQSLAVTLRGIVLGEVRRNRVAPLVLREMLVGVFSGLLTGTVIATGIVVSNMLGIINSDWRLGLVAAAAMCGALIMGTLVGVSIPLIMQRLGADPATASTIFLTMITDTTSFAALLGLAWILHDWLLAGGSAAIG